MENTSKIADISEDAAVHLIIPDKGVFVFRLIQGSPLRRLLELQEIYEEGYDKANHTSRVQQATSTG